MPQCSSAPSESRAERLVRQFYEWERWGRGWEVWNAPVELEPPFHPFFGHFDPEELRGIEDDGRKPTVLSSLLERLSAFTLGGVKRKAKLDEEVAERLPYLLEESDALVEISISLPPESKVGKDAAEQFLLGIGGVSRPVSFEVVGTGAAIEVLMACSRRDSCHIRTRLQAYFPQAILTERGDQLRVLWEDTEEGETAIVEFGLSKEFMRPLRCHESFDPDPLAGFAGAMAEIGGEDAVVFQTLFIPVVNPWPESILRAVTDGEGGSFFADDRAMVSLAGQKICSPLFAAVIRIAARSKSKEGAWNLVKQIGSSLRQFNDPASNELIPLSNDGYGDQDHVADFLQRRSRRTGMLLNADEVVSFVHPPSASVRSAKLKREERKTKAAPALAFGHRLSLGENTHSGKTAPVTLSPEQRLRHTHLIGASGTGKSTLLLNLIAQDIRNGEGLAVLDPHGDLIDTVLSYIPEERFDDVVLLDPSDEEYPVGFNILSAQSELERNLLASDLVAAFRRLSTSFGDQMTSVLGNAILAFLESSQGGTLADLRRFLVEPEFRSAFLQTVRDQEVVYYWRKEFPLLSGRPQGPILTRLDTFLRPKVIRHMVAQKENRLDFPAIMNGRKIFLAKLSQGLIGEENSYLLGTLLVSKLNQTAMSRQALPAVERTPFYLYVDEFHNFVTPSLAAILSGARKYGLGLILAHQELQQVSSRDSGVLSAVVSNPFTRICFRLGDFDAKKLEDGFYTFKAKDLQNLGVGEAICRMERSEYDFNLRTVPLPAVDPGLAQRRRDAIVASSRERNAGRRKDVEDSLRKHSPPLPVEEPVRKGRPDASAVEVSPPMESAPPLKENAAIAKTSGRGGQQHKYLQQLIKRWAETRGFQAAIEKPILDGLASVDVAIETGKVSVACEISMTTSAEHELGNIQKCLAAGFKHVLMVSPDKKVLNAVIEATMPGLTDGQRKQVRFVTPEQAFAFVESLEVKEAASIAHSSKELLTAKEVEELLRIDVKTVYSYAQKGLIPYVKMQSNLRFPKAEILAWMADKRFQPESRAKRGKR